MEKLNWKAIGNGLIIYTIGGIVYTVAAYATLKIINKVALIREAKKVHKHADELEKNQA